MRRFVVRSLSIFFSVVILLTLLLSIPSVKREVKISVESVLSKNLGFDITIDSISGFAPFFFTLNGVDFYEPESGQKAHVAKVSTMRLVPAWFDILFGKLSFYHMQVEDLTLYSAQPSNSESDSQEYPLSSYLPQKNFSLYSFTLERVNLPQDIAKKIVNSPSDLILKVEGKLSWNPKRMHLSSKFEAKELEKKLPDFSGRLDISKDEVKARASINSEEISRLAAFSFLPCKELRTTAELKTKNGKILRKIWGASTTSDEEPFFTGSFKVYAAPNDELFKKLENVRGISSEGKIQFSSDKKLSVETGYVQLYKEVEIAPPLQNEDPNDLSFDSIRKTVLVEKLKASFLGSCLFKDDLLAIDVDAKNLQFGNFNVSEFATTINAKKRQDALAFEMLANFQANSVKVNSHITGLTDLTNTLSLKDIAIQSEANTVKGSLDILFDPLLISGKLYHESSDLAPMGLLFKQNIDGKGVLRVDFTKTKLNDQDDLKQKIVFASELQGVRAQNVFFKKIECAGSSIGDFEKLITTFKLDCSQGQVKHLEIQRLNLTSEFDLFNEAAFLPFKMKTVGKNDKGAFGVELEGSLKRSKERYTLELPLFKLNLDKWRASLSSPLECTLEKDSFAIKPFELIWNTGAKLSCETKMNPDHFRGHISLQKVPLDILGLFYPSNVVTGSVSGKCDLFGSLETPLAHMNVETSSLYLGNPENAMPLEGFLQADLAANRLFCLGEISSSREQKPLHMELSIPLAFNKKSFSFDCRDNDNIFGKIIGCQEIAPLFLHFLKDDQVIEGVGEFDLAILGTFKKPELSGKFSLHKGKLDLLKCGLVFSNIELEGEAVGTTLIATKVSTTDEKQGTLTGEGKVKLSIVEHFPYEWNVDIKKMEILKYDHVEVLATGKATYSGNFLEGELKGDIACDKVELNIDSDITQEAVPALQFVYVNDPLDVEEEAKNFVLKYDVQAHIPNTGYIIGRGLNSRWKGHLKILGTSYEPLLFGDIKATTGKFSFSGKDFNLIQGDISMNGEILTQSRLNLTAERDLETMRAELLLRGTLKSPRVTFLSTPPAPEKEILAWVLFNKPLAEISPLEGLQLAQVYISLNGRSNKFNIMEKFKKTFGIDHFDISKSEKQQEEGPDGEKKSQEGSGPEVNVQIGKYLSNDLLLKLSKDVANEVNRIGVEANLHKNISVQAEVGDDQQGEMRIKWKYDY